MVRHPPSLTSERRHQQLSDKKFCVYLTVYYGNKLPPFYIGWSSRPDKVLAQKYHGSVESKRYKEIYKKELKENPHLFKSFILSYHSTDVEATAREEKFHRKLNVVNNPLYFNMGIGQAKFGGSGIHNSMYGRNGNTHPFFQKTHTKEVRNLIREANLGLVSAIDLNGIIIKVSQDEFWSNSSLIGVCSGRIRPEDERKRISISHTGKKVPETTLSKISITRKARWKSGEIAFSEEGLISLREKAKNKVVCKDKDGNVFKVSKEEFDSRQGIDLFGANFGIELECPHCGVRMHSANAKKYHFDNCKDNYQNMFFWGS